MLADALQLALERNAGLRVVAQAADARDAAIGAAAHEPDIVLIDAVVADPEVMVRLRISAPRARVVVLAAPGARSDGPAPPGASAVVHESVSVGELAGAIRRVHAEAVRTDPAARSRRERPKLTAREREVGALVAAGLHNKQIARRLRITETTVRHHVASVFVKLGVGDRLELILRYGARGSLDGE